MSHSFLADSATSVIFTPGPSHLTRYYCELAEAERLYDAEERKPCANRLKDFTNATRPAVRAFQLCPDRPEAISFLAKIASRVKESLYAETLSRAALKLNPNDHESTLYLAKAAEENGAPDTQEILEGALLSRALREDGPQDNQTAIRTIYHRYLAKKGDLKGAEEQEIAARRTGHEIPQFTRSMDLLAAGQYTAHAWEAYEGRYDVGYGSKERIRPELVWDGSPLHGKTVLIQGEGGLGDLVQWFRYAPLVKAAGGRVLASVSKAIMPLFQGWDAIDECLPTPLDRCALVSPSIRKESVESEEFSILPRGTVPRPEIAPEKVRHYDVVAPSMSLSRIFHTTQTNIPAPFAPKIPAEKLEDAHRLIGDCGFKVGLCWAASEPGRSFPLALCESLAKIPNVRLFSFQRNGAAHQDAADTNAQEQLKEVRCPITNLDQDRPDMMTGAARMACMDLVISADTFVAHLAAGMVPTFVVLRNPSDFRWGWTGETSPWYPRARLFRQSSAREWAPAIATACRAAGELAAGSSGPTARVA